MVVAVSDCDAFITAYIICTPVNRAERASFWIDGVDCVFCHGGEGCECECRRVYSNNASLRLEVD